MGTETPKRRGRPPKLQDAVAVLQTLGEPGQRRAAENAVYMGKAISLLCADGSGVVQPPYDWLNGRKTILAELGRLNDTHDIKPFAARICELKPSAVEGAALLRQVRRGGMPPGTVEGLFNVLVRGYDEYITIHNGLSSENKMLAIKQFTEAVALTVNRGDTGLSHPRQSARRPD
jgi:hypothetical protein